LRVYGRVRWVVAVDMATALGSLALSVVLIGAFGALGAALSATAALVVQNLLYQAGATGTAIGWPGLIQIRAYVSIAVAALALLVFQISLGPPLIVGVPVAGVVWLLLLRVNRDALHVATFFPELLRIPFAKYLFAPGRPRAPGEQAVS
jgi:hypothetical protein